MNPEIEKLALLCTVYLKSLIETIEKIPDNEKIYSDWMIAGKSKDMIGNLEGYIEKEKK